jgi:hypothetical protein
MAAPKIAGLRIIDHPTRFIPQQLVSAIMHH